MGKVRYERIWKRGRYGRVYWRSSKIRSHPPHTLSPSWSHTFLLLASLLLFLPVCLSLCIKAKRDVCSDLVLFSLIIFSFHTPFIPFLFNPLFIFSFLSLPVVPTIFVHACSPKQLPFSSYQLAHTCSSSPEIRWCAYSLQGRFTYGQKSMNTGSLGLLFEP